MACQPQEPARDFDTLRELEGMVMLLKNNFDLHSRKRLLRGLRLLLEEADHLIASESDPQI